MGVSGGREGGRASSAVIGQQQLETPETARCSDGVSLS